MRLKSKPAVDAAKGVFPKITKDMDGQPRIGAKDVGADEVYAGTPAHPLTRAQVGPKAP